LAARSHEAATRQAHFARIASTVRSRSVTTVRGGEREPFARICDVCAGLQRRERIRTHCSAEHAAQQGDRRCRCAGSRGATRRPDRRNASSASRGCLSPNPIRPTMSERLAAPQLQRRCRTASQAAFLKPLCADRERVATFSPLTRDAASLAEAVHDALRRLAAALRVQCAGSRTPASVGGRSHQHARVPSRGPVREEEHQVGRA